MQVEQIKVARSLAMKFIHLADELTKSQDPQNLLLFGSKLSGALRRSSLDLTRALAEMRKP